MGYAQSHSALPEHSSRQFGNLKIDQEPQARWTTFWQPASGGTLRAVNIRAASACPRRLVVFQASRSRVANDCIIDRIVAAFFSVTCIGERLGHTSIRRFAAAAIGRLGDDDRIRLSATPTKTITHATRVTLIPARIVRRSLMWAARHWHPTLSRPLPRCQFPPRRPEHPNHPQATVAPGYRVRT